MLDQLSKVWGESYIGIFRYFDGWPKMGKNGVILVSLLKTGSLLLGVRTLFTPSSWEWLRL